MFSPSQAEVLLLLMSSPGKLFLSSEIAETLYSERRDGGPEFDKSHVRKQVFDMIERCRDAGIDLRLKNPLTRYGYAFMGVVVMESPKAVLEKSGMRFGANDWRDRGARYRGPQVIYQ
jgi:hypothetical protein